MWIKKHKYNSLLYDNRILKNHVELLRNVIERTKKDFSKLSYSELIKVIKWHKEYIKAATDILRKINIRTEYKPVYKIYADAFKSLAEFGYSSEQCIKAINNKNDMKLKDVEVKAEGLTEVKRKVKNNKLIVTLEEKEKTLIGYMKEYCNQNDIRLHGMLYKPLGLTCVNYGKISFEQCHGIMKLICDDINANTTKYMNDPYHIVHNRSEFIVADYYNLLSPFKFNTCDGAQKAIHICGTEFLNKLFQID